MNFSAWHFFWAGLACAAVPIIIHLLNRRRFKTVQWAAMDFLRQALQRNRRIMQLRDLLLLLLRTAAVLLFGLALAQPFFESKTSEEFNRNQPLHAIMIVDNSLSMGYQEGVQQDETVLARTKARAEEYINQLPRGSRFTVIPLCGSPGSYSPDPYRTATDAVNALKQIEVVHRSGTLREAARLATKASEAEPNFGKRIVFLSDQQEANWRGSLNAEDLKQFPAMQVVDTSAQNPENSWISDFRLQDGVADVQSPATFLVRLRHLGNEVRKDVQVKLTVGDNEDSQTIDLEPGTAEREVVFKYPFDDIDVAPGEVAYVPVRVEIPIDDKDRLAADNQRFLVAPVVSTVPVIFIDELGADDEKPSLNKYGETYPLRVLLSPGKRDEQTPQLVKVEHIRLDQLDEDLLADARLVVMAGVDDPRDKVEMLRQYVDQGGQLFIAAGGAFNPQAWTNAAWLDGKGILPTPLAPELYGAIPGTEGKDVKWFQLAYDNVMRSQTLFHLAGSSDEFLRDFYSDAYFFQAVDIEDFDKLEPQMVEAEMKRLDEQFTAVSEAQARLKKFAELEAKGLLSDEERSQKVADENHLATLKPQWLRWSNQAVAEAAAIPADKAEREKLLRDLARRAAPQLLARFNNGKPYLVERDLGQGRVVFCTSGIMDDWNTVAKMDTVALFDRVLRGMLGSTLPSRNFAAQDRIMLPVDPKISGWSFELKRPQVGEQAPLVEEMRAGYLDAQTHGLMINDALYQGIYMVTAKSPAESADPTAQREKVELPLAVNLYEIAGGAGESDLTPLSRAQFDERRAGEKDIPIEWVAAGETIGLDGTTIMGQNTWILLVLAVLLLLLAEILVLAWPAMSSAPVAQPTGAPQAAH